MSDEPRATVREIDGQLVLDDPDALAVARVVAKHNCKLTLEANADRVVHFTQRIRDRELSPTAVVIVLLNVDDPYGGILAEALMPGHNWQQFRDRGEVPYARGLVMREGLLPGLEALDAEEAEKLRQNVGVAILVMDFGVARVFA